MVSRDGVFFWDASIGQELADLNGLRLRYGELCDACELRADRTGYVGERFWRDRSCEGFHPLAAVRPRRWERALAVMIYATSGQLAQRAELLQGRRVLAALPRSVRRSLEPREVLAMLAPLLIGFRLSSAHAFVEEANRPADAARVLARLLAPEPLSIEIPLCSHRERASIAPNALTSAPDASAVARVCGLLQLLLGNARSERARVTFLQQGPTERAASCMFPSVFAAYADRGAVDELLDTLAAQHRSLRAAIAPFDRGRVSFRVAALDSLSLAAEADLAAELGPEWPFLQAPPTRLSWLHGGLGMCALGLATREVGRLMQLARAPGSANARSDVRQRTVAERALDFFQQKRGMSQIGRALFELAFYRRWALSALERKSLGLGFDRDFGAHQRLAWSLAANSLDSEDSERPVPLLYARRTLATQPGGSLRGLSYRQFWVA